MNKAINFSRISIMESIIFFIVLLLQKCLCGVEEQYNLGIWNLFHGNVNVISMFVMTYQDLLLIIFCVMLLVTADNLLDRKELRIVVGLIRGAVAVAILYLLLNVIIYTLPKYKKEADIVKIRNIISTEHSVVHAGGYVQTSDGENRNYTNSYEALINSYSLGNRVVEIDFSLSSDGKVICAHFDEDDPEKYEGYISADEVTEQDFLKLKAYGELTTMNLDVLAKFMDEHEDLFIVTDFKGDYEGLCKALSEQYPGLRERFLVQIYHPYGYETAEKAGFKYMIYTMYCAGRDEVEEEAILEACRRYDILALTYWSGWLKKDKYSELKKNDIPKCEHTVNDETTIREDLSDGISCVYTDNVDNEWMRQQF